MIVDTTVRYPQVEMLSSDRKVTGIGAVSERIGYRARGGDAVPS